MINEYFGKPLYPQEDFGEKENQQNDKFSSFQSGNQLLSLLLGLKNGAQNENIANLLSKFGGNSPIFQALSSFTNNKKESQTNSPKTLLDDEIIY